MNLQNFRARLHVRETDANFAIKATGTQERRIEQIRSICRADENYTRVRSETVHLREELVECLFVLLRASRSSSGALRPQGVNFVHKNQARSVDARALEEISYPRRTDTDNDFDEF